MSKKQYLKALNMEIQKLNDVIDRKILHDLDYKREAKRHKKLLAEVRKREVGKSFSLLTRTVLPTFFL